LPSTTHGYIGTCYVEFFVNTQTHILLAAALLAGPSKSVPNTNGQQGISRTRSRTVNLAVLLGAVLPDLSLFFMWGQAKARGIPDSIIWEELYFSPFWQEVGAITNSIPIFAGIAIIGFIMVGREWLTQHPHFYAKGIGFALLFLGLAALTHCLSDLPLHVDDGHTHFWPISNWIYSSPVSY